MNSEYANYDGTRWVLADRQDDFRKKMTALQARAEKMGQPPIHFEATGKVSSFKLPVYQDGQVMPGVHMDALKVEYAVSGTFPRLNGFEFLAQIDHNKNSDGTYSNLVNTAGSKSADVLDGTGTDYHICSPSCDCCKQSRNRSSTFLVRKIETGDIEQIGSSCVDAYIGTKTLSQVVAAFNVYNFVFGEEYFDEMDNEYSRSNATPEWVSVRNYLAMAAYLTETKGFVKTGEFDSTRDTIVYDIAKPGANKDSVLTHLSLNIARDDILTAYHSKADEIIAHFSKDEAQTTYVKNAQTLIKMGCFPLKHNLSSGILASLPSSHQQFMLRELDKKKIENNTYLNEHFGKLKSRGQLKLCATKVKEVFDVQFPFTKYSFIDDHGRKFQWKASNSGPDLKIAAGDTLIATATISSHFSYDGMHYTAINRLSNIEKVAHDTPAPDFDSKPKKISTERIKVGFTPENEQGETDGHSYIYVEREWKEKRRHFDMYFTLPFPLPEPTLLQGEITRQAARYVYAPRVPEELHPSDAEFMALLTKELTPFVELSNKAREKNKQPIFIAESADRKLLSNIPAAPFEVNSLIAGKLFTSYSQAESAAAEMDHGRIIGVNVGTQKPMYLPSDYRNEFGHEHFEAMSEKAKKLGYTHYVFMGEDGEQEYILPILWDKPEDLTLTHMQLPKGNSRSPQSFNHSRIFCVVGVSNRDALTKMQDFLGPFTDALLEHKYLPDFCHGKGLDFNGLTPASYLLNETSPEIKNKTKTSRSLFSFTDSITPELLSRAGAEVTVLTVRPDDNKQTLNNSANVLHVDMNDPDAIINAISSWVEANPVISIENTPPSQERTLATKPSPR